MDINQALADALELAHQIQDHDLVNDTIEGAADELATLVIEIDHWIRKGGHVPTAWMSL